MSARSTQNSRIVSQARLQIKQANRVEYGLRRSESGVGKVDESGMFRTPGERQSVVQVSGVTPDKRTVAYCNEGGAVTSALFACGHCGGQANACWRSRK